MGKPDYHGLEVARPLANVLELHIGIHNFAVCKVCLHVHDVTANAGADVALRRQHQLLHSKVSAIKWAATGRRTVISLEETIVNSTCFAFENIT